MGVSVGVGLSVDDSVSLSDFVCEVSVDFVTLMDRECDSSSVALRLTEAVTDGRDRVIMRDVECVTAVVRVARLALLERVADRCRDSVAEAVLERDCVVDSEEELVT